MSACGESYTGDNHIKSTPKALRWSSLLMTPGRSPMPSLLESKNDAGQIWYPTASFHQALLLVMAVGLRDRR